MDRAVGSTKSQTNSSVNNTAQQQHTGHQSKSAMVKAAASVKNLMDLGLLSAVPKKSDQENYSSAQQIAGKGLNKTLEQTSTNKGESADITEHPSKAGPSTVIKLEASITDEKLKDRYQELKVKVLCPKSHIEVFSPKENSILQQVTELNLRYCTNLTADLVKDLIRRCMSLKTLNLTGCKQLNPFDLVHIATISDGIKELNVSACIQINDMVVSMLPKMFQLERLYLSGCTGFNRQSLGHLSKLKKLEALSLKHCRQIQDADLGRLRGLKQLKYLDIRNCQLITPKGIKTLMDSMPWLEFVDNDFSTFARKPQPYQGELHQAKKTRLG